MKASEMFEGENSSLRKTFDKATMPDNTPEPILTDEAGIKEVLREANNEQRKTMDMNTPDTEWEEEIVKHLVDRFLGWRLPKDFHPDGGISFNREYNVSYNANQGLPPSIHEPTGTNLFNAEQAKEMFRFLLENEDGTSAHHTTIRTLVEMIGEMVEWRPIETAPRDGTHILVMNMNTPEWNRVPTVAHFFTDGNLYLSWNKNGDDADYQMNTITHWKPTDILSDLKIIKDSLDK